MNLITVQWNIGGGKIRKSDSDPTMDFGNHSSSYDIEGLDYVIEKLKEYNPDIIMLQETHASNDYIQAKKISEKLGLQYWTNDKYSDSHIENGQGLCQSIISRYPISNHSFEFFKNPNFQVTAENGDVWKSHDKGYTLATIEIKEGINLNLGTLHLVPFRRFNRQYTDPEVLTALKNVSDVVLNGIGERTLIQGDFNLDSQSLRPYFPELLEKLNEIEVMEPTTPKGRKYDHVLYKGINVVSDRIGNTVLTDHYPIISEFDLL